jgi:hypothetical protein
MRRLFWVVILALAALPAGLRAMQLTVGPDPLQRALQKQLFSAPDGRYYLRGNRTSGCFLYAQNPQLHFNGNRIFLDLHLAGKLGGSFAGQCLGFGWAGDVEVSMLPQAQGSTIGFTDVRVEKLTSDHSLDQMLEPLLARVVPKSIKVDAAQLVGRMLQTASNRSGATIALQQLQIQLLQVQGEALQLTLDGAVSIQ